MHKKHIFNRRRNCNTVQLLHERAYYNVETLLCRRFHTPTALMTRLANDRELNGHDGCVNGLEWSSNGRLLASVSDDCHLMLWDAFRHRRLSVVHTKHKGNIFAVKFIPHSGDNRVATGAADCAVLLHDVERSGRNISIGSQVDCMEALWKCRCHQKRVKSLAVAPDNPHMLWTSAEDGRILQFDLRESHSCRSKDRGLLINLRNHTGVAAEIKCIAINGRRPEQLAVGANDSFARIFDLRQIKTQKLLHLDNGFGPNVAKTMKIDDNLPAGCATYFCPGHFHKPIDGANHMFKTVTYVAFSPDGNELLVNVGAEQIYLYDLIGQRRPQFVELPVANAAAAAATTKKSAPIPASVEARKEQGNKHMHAKQFFNAIDEYSLAIAEAPEYAALYLNRAMAFSRRDWCGDQYAALRDCKTALRLQPAYVKAHFRWARALLKLRRAGEASDCLAALQQRFPDMQHDKSVLALRLDIEKALSNEYDAAAPDVIANNSRYLSKAECAWRRDAFDYEERFVGHCNTTTDIKQANFFGNDGRYIVAGSDDGNIFIWNRDENRIVKIFDGDRSIVNCVQPHPFYCLLATSGIDDAIRLWSPAIPHENKTGINFVNVDVGQPRDREKIVHRNQLSMQADPFDYDLFLNINSI